jgi:hypothetical protein
MCPAVTKGLPRVPDVDTLLSQVNLREPRARSGSVSESAAISEASPVLIRTKTAPRWGGS